MGDEAAYRSSFLQVIFMVAPQTARFSSLLLYSLYTDEEKLFKILW